MTVLAQGGLWIILAAALNASALALLRTAGLQTGWVLPLFFLVLVC